MCDWDKRCKGIQERVCEETEWAYKQPYVQLKGYTTAARHTCNT
jgi:hypothetical protein